MSWPSKSLARVQKLRTAQAALFRVRDGAWARKADAPEYERHRQREQDRRDLKAVVENLTPIVEARVAEAARYDAECSAIKADGGHGIFTPAITTGGLTTNENSQVRQVADATGAERRELEVFENRIRDAYLRSGGDLEGAAKAAAFARAEYLVRKTMRGGQ